MYLKNKNNGWEVYVWNICWNNVGTNIIHLDALIFQCFYAVEYFFCFVFVLEIANFLQRKLVAVEWNV